MDYSKEEHCYLYWRNCQELRSGFKEGGRTEFCAVKDFPKNSDARPRRLLQALPARL
jgi:hypothetical protein